MPGVRQLLRTAPPRAANEIAVRVQESWGPLPRQPWIGVLDVVPDVVSGRRQCRVTPDSRPSRGSLGRSDDAPAPGNTREGRQQLHDRQPSGHTASAVRLQARKVRSLAKVNRASRLGLVRGGCVAR